MSQPLYSGKNSVSLGSTCLIWNTAAVQLPGLLIQKGRKAMRKKRGAKMDHEFQKGKRRTKKCLTSKSSHLPLFCPWLVFYLTFYSESASTTSWQCYTINIWWPLQVKFPHFIKAHAIHADIWHIFSSVPAVWSHLSLFFAFHQWNTTALGKQLLHRWVSLKADCKFIGKLLRNWQEAALTEPGYGRRVLSRMNGQVSGGWRAFKFIRSFSYIGSVILALSWLVLVSTAS